MSDAPPKKPRPLFLVGQLVRHLLFEYRGVVIDIDETFSHDDDWYDLMAKSEPPKDHPWYRVLVHGASHETYVAERNLEPDASGEPIAHPLIGEVFDALVDGHYVRNRNLN